MACRRDRSLRQKQQVEKGLLPPILRTPEPAALSGIGRRSAKKSLGPIDPLCSLRLPSQAFVPALLEALHQVIASSHSARELTSAWDLRLLLDRRIGAIAS